MGPTLVATLLGTIAALYFFMEPIGSLVLKDPIAQLGAGVVWPLRGGKWMDGGVPSSSVRKARAALDSAEEEKARAEQEAVRAEEEAARAEEESARAEEEMLHAEEQTARAEVEAGRATRESERVERILGSISDAFTVLDHNWVITYMNERAAALAGGKVEDYLGRNHWEAFPAMIGTPFEHAYRRARAGEHVVRALGYYEPSRKWIEVTAYPSSEGLTVVGQDVTERVGAEESTARLAAIVASSEDAIVGKKLDGTITSWNAGAERIFGYSESEMVGSSIYRLVPPELHGAERDMHPPDSPGPAGRSPGSRAPSQGWAPHHHLPQRLADQGFLPAGSSGPLPSSATSPRRRAPRRRWRRRVPAAGSWPRRLTWLRR